MIRKLQEPQAPHRIRTTIKTLRSFAPPDSRGRLSLHEHLCRKHFIVGSFHICKVDDKPHFVTFCSYQRWILPEAVRSLVLECCLHDNGTMFDLKVVVVMPDHVHMIFTPMVNAEQMEVCSLGEIMDAVKGASAHRINKALGRKGRVWQTESFDHALRSSENLDAKVQYLLENPVRAGLAATWQEYPWIWKKAFVNPYGLAVGE